MGQLVLETRAVHSARYLRFGPASVCYRALLGILPAVVCPASALAIGGPRLHARARVVAPCGVVCLWRQPLNTSQDCRNKMVLCGFADDTNHSWNISFVWPKKGNIRALFYDTRPRVGLGCSSVGKIRAWGVWSHSDLHRDKNRYVEKSKVSS